MATPIRLRNVTSSSSAQGFYALAGKAVPQWVYRAYFSDAFDFNQQYWVSENGGALLPVRAEPGSLTQTQLPAGLVAAVLALDTTEAGHANLELFVGDTAEDAVPLTQAGTGSGRYSILFSRG